MRLHLLLGLTLIPLLATSCSTKQVNKIEFYQDNSTISDDDININMTTEPGSIVYGGNVSVVLELTNTNPKPRNIKITDEKIFRESNGAEYSAVARTLTSITLECDIQKSITFYATLPTNVDEDKYYFTLKYDNTEIIYHLYEREDSQREEINIEFYLDGLYRETKKIPYGRELVDYPWISSDYVYSSEKWYTDPDMIHEITSDFKVTKALKVYGREEAILQYHYPYGSAFVSGINYVPTNNEVIVPKKYGNMEVYSILAGAFRDTGTIYNLFIPSTLNSVGGFNFTTTPNLRYISFEGTKEQWDSINEATIPSKVTMVYNTYK